jgi:hypothetical protein
MWRQLLLNWVQANQGGENKPFLPEPYLERVEL